MVVEGVQKLREGAVVVTGGGPRASGPADITDAGAPPAKSPAVDASQLGTPDTLAKGVN